jgi:hypothetical protein
MNIEDVAGESLSIFYFNMRFVFFNKEFFLAIQEFILLMNGSY